MHGGAHVHIEHIIGLERSMKFYQYFFMIDSTQGECSRVDCAHRTVNFAD